MIKRISIIILSILFSLNLFSIKKDTYIINGKIGNYTSPVKAYLVRQVSNQFVIDTCLLNNGQFKFSGYAKYPFYAHLILDRDGLGLINAKSDLQEIYVDLGTMTVTGKDSMATAKITGSKIQDLDQLYKKEYDKLGIREHGEQLKKFYENSSIERRQSKQLIDSIKHVEDSLNNAYFTHLLSFVRQHSNSMYGIFLLQSKVNSNPESLVLQEAYNLLSPDIKNTDLGLEMADRLKKIRPLISGDSAPDFTSKNIEGIPKSLSDFKGKYILLSFWSPECEHCLGELASMKESYQKFKDHNFEIIGVAIESGERRQIWADIIKNESLTWTNVSDLNLWKSDVVKLYKVFRFPLNFLIAPDGKIIGKDLYGEDLMKKLDEVLQ